jgi:hypothetical protein
MGEPMKLGSAKCATCGGRGITTDADRRPHPCVPCSSERREEQVREHGYSLDCRSCTATLTLADVAVGRAKPKPVEWRLYGALCGPCLASLRERKSA